MITKNTIYNFKDEFCSELGIGVRAWKNRKKDLLEWLANFYEYELLEGRPIRIHIKEIYGEYQPLPRKINIHELTEQKKQDYTNFAIASLGTEFKPNSKVKVAREAIVSFGQEKYGHSNAEAVGRRYVGPAFNEYGECNNIKRWVWYSTYEPLDAAALERWRAIMAEEHISEKEAANAFYRHAEGEDISKEKSYFMKARMRFKEEFGDTAILISDWRLKNK